MKSYRKILLAAVLIGILTLFIAWAKAPHLSAPCEEAREQMKQLMLNDNGLAGAIAMLPEPVLDQALGEYYEHMPAQQCNKLAPELAQSREALVHTKWAEKIHEAGKQAAAAVSECRSQRLKGEIASHAASVECSSPKVRAAFARIGYPYMDLVEKLNAKRLEAAEHLDKNWLSGTEDQMEFARLAIDIAEQEGERNQEFRK